MAQSPSQRCRSFKSARRQIQARIASNQLIHASIGFRRREVHFALLIVNRQHTPASVVHVARSTKANSTSNVIPCTNCGNYMKIISSFCARISEDESPTSTAQSASQFPNARDNLHQKHSEQHEKNRATLL